MTHEYSRIRRCRNKSMIVWQVFSTFCSLTVPLQAPRESSTRVVSPSPCTSLTQSMSSAPSSSLQPFSESVCLLASAEPLSIGEMPTIVSSSVAALALVFTFPSTLFWTTKESAEVSSLSQWAGNRWMNSPASLPLILAICFTVVKAFCQRFCEISHGRDSGSNLVKPNHKK